jgi:hypothetical protein
MLLWINFTHVDAMHAEMLRIYAIRAIISNMRNHGNARALCNRSNTLWQSTARVYTAGETSLCIAILFDGSEKRFDGRKALADWSKA